MFRPMFLFDTDPDSGTGGTGTPGDAPGNGDQNADPVKKPGTDWEAAYKGLQRLQQRTKKELDELQVKFDALVDDHETEKQTHKEITGKYSELQKQNVDLTSQVKSVQEQEASRTLERDRYNLILSEFSDLASFEADSLLPAGTNVDELREKFEKFRKSLEKSGKQRVKDALEGEGPGPVGDDNSRDPGKKRSVDEVYNELLALGGTQSPEGRAKYDKLMEEWIALN